MSHEKLIFMRKSQVSSLYDKFSPKKISVKLKKNNIDEIFMYKISKT